MDSEYLKGRMRSSISPVVQAGLARIEALEADKEALRAEVERLRKWTEAAETALDEGVSAKIAAEAKAEALQAEVEQRCNEYNELTMRYAKAIARDEGRL